MGNINENRLKTDLKSGRLERAYFLYGSEDYLVRFFADKITELAVPEDARDMNFVRYTEAPKADALSDQLENMPFFSEYKCVLIKDLDIDSLEAAEHKAYLALIKNIPETSVLIIAQENIAYEKKPKAATKKMIEAVESVGVSCEMMYLTEDKVAARAQKEAAKAGCSLSPENARLLARECGNSLTVLENELAKLCSYRNSGEITAADIEGLVPKRIDTNIFNLAKELFAGRTSSALEILNDVFAQNAEPNSILSALSGHFIDLYRAKLGKLAKKTAYDASAAFKYPPNRSFVMNNAYRSVDRLSERYLGKCVEVLYNTNRLLNSSQADKRQLIEKAIIEIASLPRN